MKLDVCLEVIGNAISSLSGEQMVGPFHSLDFKVVQIHSHLYMNFGKMTYNAIPLASPGLIHAHFKVVV